MTHPHGPAPVIYRANCMQRGCNEPNAIACSRCGLDKEEYQRRKKLPLEKLPSGLYGIVLRDNGIEEMEEATK